MKRYPPDKGSTGSPEGARGQAGVSDEQSRRRGAAEVGTVQKGGSAGISQRQSDARGELPSGRVDSGSDCRAAKQGRQHDAAGWTVDGKVSGQTSGTCRQNVGEPA